MKRRENLSRVVPRCSPFELNDAFQELRHFFPNYSSHNHLQSYL